MRAELIRIYKTVHTVTGITAGLGLFIAFFAGALTIVKEPIARWASRPVTEAFTPIEDSDRLMREVLRAHPEAARRFTLHLEQTEAVPARLSWKVLPASADDHDESGARYFAAGFDEAGALAVREFQPSPLGSFIDTLHRVVGLPVDDDPNRLVMGFIVTLYGLALFSGVVIAFPTLLRDFFALRIGKNLKRMWMDVHNALGILSLPFHFVIVITAAVFAFHDAIYAVQGALFDVGRERPAAGAREVRDLERVAAPNVLLARVRETAPAFRPTSLQYLNLESPRAVVRVFGDEPSHHAPRAVGAVILLDPYTARIRSLEMLPSRQSAPQLVLSSAFTLHMGAFGGVLVKGFYVVLGVAGAFLFYTGNLLYLESRRLKPRADELIPKQPFGLRALGPLTVGVCFGCLVGVASMFASTKWISGRVEDVELAHRSIYYGGLALSIVWAFARGRTRASIELRRVLGLLLVLVPLGSILAPAFGTWASSSAEAFGVDVTAFAVGFLALASTLRRAKTPQK